MARELQPMNVHSVTLSIKGLMRTLKMKEEAVIRFMGQARAVTHLATEWVEQAYCLKLKPNGEDFLIKGGLQDTKANIRTFKAGRIRFQQSKRTGVRRDPMSTRADMLHDTSAIDIFFVVDIRYFPRIDIYPVKSAQIINFIHGHDVGKNGISPLEFDKFITENFEVNFRNFDHMALERRRQRIERQIRKGTINCPSIQLAQR